MITEYYSIASILSYIARGSIAGLSVTMAEENEKPVFFFDIDNCVCFETI